MDNRSKEFYDILFDPWLPLTRETTSLTPIYIVDSEKHLPPSVCESHVKFAKNLGFFSSQGERVFLPAEDGSILAVLIRLNLSVDRFNLGSCLARLPDGNYEIKTELQSDKALETMIGFCLSAYRFELYKKKRCDFGVKIFVPSGIDFDKLGAFVKSEYFVRNLINTPASDLGPKSLERAIEFFCHKMKANFTAIIGDQLLKSNFPLIHAVGRAGSEAPRLAKFTWGNPNSYKITLVGKGVCFDTGGLNVNPDASMAAMKKDMGGAASALGLANCIISLKLDVYLTVIIPIVENSISSNSFRPGDILSSRKGLDVEVNNTDAEGRLILADALSYADESRPDIIICMATLTGAARVALGQDIVPFYTESDEFSKLLSEGSVKNFDPIWRLPLHSEYEHMIESQIADLDNAPKSGMAGSITAALFLNRFVENSKTFAHFDIYSWSSKTRPGRSVGGLMQAVRAIYYALEKSLM